jgi:nucleoside-diphosphate-sugar epimerase
MKRVLVTGATGFIGRHCLAPLVSRGFDVHALFNSRPALDAAKVTWHRADLLDPGEIMRIFSAVGPTHLLHLAWYADPRDYRTAPANLAWLQAGVEILRRFGETGGQRAVFAGTCFEYDVRYGYCTEGLTPEAPSTLYAVCKNSLRQVVARYAADANLSCAWARVFYVFGPFEPPGRLVPSVVTSLLSSERAECTHGRQLRDFLFVEDVASALVATLDSSIDGSVNVGSGEPVSVRTIVEKVARRLNACDCVDFGARKGAPTDAPVTFADVRRLRDEIGWRPRLSLEDGLNRTIGWWKANLA